MGKHFVNISTDKRNNHYDCRYKKSDPERKFKKISEPFLAGIPTVKNKTIQQQQYYNAEKYWKNKAGGSAGQACPQTLCPPSL